MVRLAPRDELAAAARVAPLLRAARDLARWAATRQAEMPGPWPAARLAADQDQRDIGLSASEAASAAEDLDLTQDELQAAWLVAEGARMLGQDGCGQPPDILAAGDPEAVLGLWDNALGVTLRTTELDGLVTALYTVGGPVRIDALFEAYDTARRQGLPGDAGTQEAADGPDVDGARPTSWRCPPPWRRWPTSAWSSSAPTRRPGRSPSRCPRWAPGACTARLRAQGWHVPVLGAARAGPRGRAARRAGQLRRRGRRGRDRGLAGRARPGRGSGRADRRGRGGSPGLRGAAFAVLDRIGAEAIPAVREALADPLLRAHAAVWLREHGEEAELARDDRTGCSWTSAPACSRRPPEDVVAELLPDLPPAARPRSWPGSGRCPSGGDRPADRARRAPSRPRGGQGRAQGGVQGALPRGRGQQVAQPAPQAAIDWQQTATAG